LIVADSVIIPIDSSSFALLGMNQLLKTIAAISETYNSSLKILVLTTMFNRRSPTARRAGPESGTFRITHPYHPLAGQEFEQIKQRHTCDEERVYFYDRAGGLRAAPLGWTSLAPPDPFVVIAAGRSLFRVADLLELTRLGSREL
jgi:hypothetical protein